MRGRQGFALLLAGITGTVAIGSLPATAQPDDMARPAEPTTSTPGSQQATAAVAPLPTAAPAYVQMAASGDQFEIRSSQLALQSSRNRNVRSFAQQLIDDHTKLSAQLMTAAQSAGLPAPQPVLAAHHQQMLDQLRSAPKSSFDKQFRQHQVAAHQEALTLHRTYAAGGDQTALRAVAAQAVPAIEMHLRHAEALPGKAAH